MADSDYSQEFVDEFTRSVMPYILELDTPDDIMQDMLSSLPDDLSATLREMMVSRGGRNPTIGESLLFLNPSFGATQQASQATTTPQTTGDSNKWFEDTFTRLLKVYGTAPDAQEADKNSSKGDKSSE